MSSFDSSINLISVNSTKLPVSFEIQATEAQISPALSFKELKQWDQDKRLGSLTLEHIGLTQEQFACIKPEDLKMNANDFKVLTPQQCITKIARQILKQGEREELGYQLDIQRELENNRKLNQMSRIEKQTSSRSERWEFIQHFSDTFERLLHNFNEVLDMDVPSERAAVPSSVKDAYLRVDAVRTQIIGLLLQAEELGLLEPKSQLEMLAGGGKRGTPLAKLLKDLKGSDICHNALATDGLKLARTIKENLEE